MKKKLLITIIVFLFFISNTTAVSADMGPKPALEVTIVGVEEAYYFDLLTYYPDDLDNHTQEEPWNYYQDDFSEELIGYQDPSGFISYSIYDVPSSIDYIGKEDRSEIFSMRYIAPRKFKIVLVMIDNDAIIISDYIETNRFESNVTWDLTGVNLTSSSAQVGVLSGDIVGDAFVGSNSYITAINTLIRVIVTLTVELGLLYLFKYRKKDSFIKVGITNIITQLGLSILTISAYLTGGPFMFILAIIFLEFIVLGVEIVTYLLIVKEHTRTRIVIYTAIANFLSLALGAFITTLI